MRCVASISHGRYELHRWIALVVSMEVARSHPSDSFHNSREGVNPHPSDSSVVSMEGAKSHCRMSSFWARAKISKFSKFKISSFRKNIRNFKIQNSNFSRQNFDKISKFKIRKKLENQALRTMRSNYIIQTIRRQQQWRFPKHPRLSRRITGGNARTSKVIARNSRRLLRNSIGNARQKIRLFGTRRSLHIGKIDITKIQNFETRF